MVGAGQRRLTAQQALSRWLGVGCVAAGFAVATLFIAPGDIEPEPSPAFADEPDAYVEDGLITQYDADGALRYRLRSQRIAYFESEGRTRLSAPVFELHNPDAPPWRVEAEVGDVYRLGNGEEEVYLRGAVELARNRGGDGLLSMRTESLTVNPVRRFARTSEPAIIATRAARVTAAGFETDLASGRTKLLSSANQRVAIVVPANEFK